MESEDALVAWSIVNWKVKSFEQKTWIELLIYDASFTIA